MGKDASGGAKKGSSSSGSSVTSFNGRNGAVVPDVTDYEAFYLALDGSNSPMTGNVDWGAFSIFNIGSIYYSDGVTRAIRIENSVLIDQAGADSYNWNSRTFSGWQKFSSGINQQGTTVNYGTTNTVTRTTFAAFTDVSGAGTGTTTMNISNATYNIGDIIYFSDIDRKSNANNIVLDVGGGNTIISTTAAAQTYTISVNGASIQMRKFSATQWKII